MSQQAERARKDEVVNYQQTVAALMAFAAFITHTGAERRTDAQFGLGRRMTPRNAIQPNSEVTPDLVAQKSPMYGVVGEVKRSLPLDDSHWDRYLLQLKKYDDDLQGWWTDSELIPVWNVALLLHHSRSRVFVHYLEDRLRQGSSAVGPNACIIEFSVSEETTRYYFYRLEWGSIHDDELSTRLRNGVSVPLDKVLSSFPNIRYYDSEPPLELLLTDLWTDAFPSLAADVPLDEKEDARIIDVNVDMIAEELQRAYGSLALYSDRRSGTFPRPATVRRALEALVKYRLAIPPATPTDPYRVRYRPFKKDVLERFIELKLKGHEATPQTPEQLTLLPDQSDS